MAPTLIISTRPYETNPAIVASVDEAYPKALVEILQLSRDTLIFGSCLVFVYGISYALVRSLSNFANFSAKTSERIAYTAPIILSTPFWAGVIICSSNLTPDGWLSSFRLPFNEALFWATALWTLFISAFVIIATLACLVMRPFQNDDGANRIYTDFDLKFAEEYIPLTGAPAVKEEWVSVVASPLPVTDEKVTVGSRPRMGSITRCWH